MKWRATAWAWFSTFLEKVLVSRVNRRIPILMVRLARSTWLVLTWAGLGVPLTRSLIDGSAVGSATFGLD